MRAGDGCRIIGSCILANALTAAKLGDWSWDAGTHVVTFSERAAETFQIPPGPHMTWTAMRELRHPAGTDSRPGRNSPARRPENLGVFTCVK